MFFSYRTHGKRLLDIVLAALAGIALAPVLVVVAALVCLKLGRPILFCQTRPGLHGRLFQLYKFRTMRDACDSSGRHLSDEERLTPFGRWLRSTSLDELPELWNVARGEMSFVGPRPLLVEYLPRYTREQARRHDAKPGLTGLAQISGRNTISWNEKFEFDLRYVDSVSFWQDVRLLCVTVGRVLRRDGIQAASHATMPVFNGAAFDEATSHAVGQAQ